MLTIDFAKIDLRPGMTVLDAGCGSGRHACEAFRQAGVRVVAVDLRWEDLRQTAGTLAAMAPDRRGEWGVYRADVTRLPFPDEAFDRVICSEVLEHVAHKEQAVVELLRVLKKGGDLVVSVPRFFPERVCWLLSSAYHAEPGGHIRIFKKKELQCLMEAAGARCWSVRYKHALHAPYWWLRCLVGHRNEQAFPVRLYKRFLEWDILSRPRLTRRLERMLDPLLAKSVVFYLKKGC